MSRYCRYLILAVGFILLLFPISAIGCGSQLPGTVSSDGANATNPIPKGYADFEVGPLMVTRSGVSVGEMATVSTKVTNTGGVKGTYTAVLTVDGQQAGKEEAPIRLNVEIG